MKFQDNINLESALNFDNKYTRELPADPETANKTRHVASSCYSRVLPVKASAPDLVAYSREMAGEIGLSPKICESEDFVQIFSGSRILSGMDPYATCYGGHQFGSWAGQLGDGRAINLGEVVNKEGNRWVLQLKGAGPTPYSRRGDGFAVLRSSIREFLCSEAMYHLGIPTTRALSLVTTGDQVIRDMFYDGHPEPEPGAIV
ncbi:YdiU family protein, partial [bacterium]|nr:YdiU family protein [bacterium]